MSSVFSHESAQRNDAGHLIDKTVFKTTRSFPYRWIRVSTLQANANKPFKLSNMKRTTGGGHLENAFLNFVPKGFINDIPASVQIMVCRLTGAWTNNV